MTVDGESKTKITEAVGGRGDGALIFKRQRVTVEAFYRYRTKGKDRLIFISHYGRNARNGYSLPDIREKAREYARLKKEVAPVDLKEHLEVVKAERQRKQEVLKRETAIEASRGSLEDLCRSYIGSLQRRKAPSAKDVERSLSYNLFNPFPELSLQKANSITTDDLMPVFQRILKRGVTTGFNRFRSYLLAAYNLGLKADYDPRQQLETGKRFGIQFNPVVPIPKYADYERVRERVLSNDEIQQFWNNVEKGTPDWSPLYGLLARFCLACYGNRPEQLNHIRWSDIDFNQRTLVSRTPKEKMLSRKNGSFLLPKGRWIYWNKPLYTENLNQNDSQPKICARQLPACLQIAEY
ncbi:hypothetical protein [Endozoicomonas sp. SESOKO3]|nr:hypothetical protein [Endozoicomonas sp. SESOKO3]